MTDIEQQWVETEDENALRAHIFETDDRKELIVPVPEWGTKILIKQVTGKARSEVVTFQTDLVEKHGKSPDYYKRLWFELARVGCMHPTTKRPLFKTTDRDTLCDNKNGAIIQMLGETVQGFSNLDGTASMRAKKNLGLIQSSSTTTESQSNETASESMS